MRPGCTHGASHIAPGCVSCQRAQCEAANADGFRTAVDLLMSLARVADKPERAILLKAHDRLAGRIRKR